MDVSRVCVFCSYLRLGDVGIRPQSRAFCDGFVGSCSQSGNGRQAAELARRRFSMSSFRPSVVGLKRFGYLNTQVQYQLGNGPGL